MSRKFIENASKPTVYMREYRKNHPEILEYSKEYNKKTLSTEEGKINNRYRANSWAAANRERSRENARQRDKFLRENYPEKYLEDKRASTALRRARIKGVTADIIDYDLVKTKSKGKCGICKQPIIPGADFDYDHIIPISKGGPHSTDNLQISHPRCNRIKASRITVDVSEEDNGATVLRYYTRKERKAA